MQPDYYRLLSMVTGFSEERQREKNRQAMLKPPPSKGLPAAKAKTEPGKAKGYESQCRQFRRTGSCPRPKGECPFAHDRKYVEKGGKSEGKGQERGRSFSRKAGGNSSQNPPKAKAEAKAKSKPRTGKSPSGKLERPSCRFHKSGSCTKQSDCDFWHPPPCRLFKQGKCTQGNQCPYTHSPAVTATDAAPKAKAKAKSSTPVVSGPGGMAIDSDCISAMRRSSSPVNRTVQFHKIKEEGESSSSCSTEAKDKEFQDLSGDRPKGKLTTKETQPREKRGKA